MTPGVLIAQFGSVATHRRCHTARVARRRAKRKRPHVSVPETAGVGPFDRFVALTQALAGSLELPDVLERVVQAATDLVPDTAAGIWVADGAFLVLRAQAGTAAVPGGCEETVLVLGEGQVGRAAAIRQASAVGDAWEANRCSQW